MASRLWTGILLLIGVLANAGCGWRRSVTFQSTELGERVEIYQPRYDPMLGLRIDFVAGSHTSTLLRAGETYIGFAHAYWGNSGHIVGVLVCGTREVRIAYDSRWGTQIPFASIEGGLNADVRKIYGADPAGYPASMCLGTYYQGQFQRRFPKMPH